MSQQEYIVSLDVGSYQVKTVIAQLTEQGKPRIVGVGIAPSNGIRKGVVIDLDETTQSIKESILQAEKLSGVKIQSAYVSVGGSHLSCQSTKGVIAVGRADGEVQPEDVERVMEASKAISLPHNYELIHIIPQEFILDGQHGIKDPVGMNGIRLEIKGILITGFSPHLRNITKCVQGSGIEVEGFVAAPIAASKSILEKRQQELGVALLDLGGGTASMAVFEERELIHLAVLPVGSGHITNDIAIGMRTSIETAEKVKVKLGTALPDEIDEKEQIILNEMDPKEEGVFSRRHVAEIIQARLEEIYYIAEKELKKIGKSALLPAGVVLVGGGAKLPGAVDLAKNILKLPAQTGFPKELSGLIDRVDDPSFAVSVGMIIHVLESNLDVGMKISTESEIFSVLGKAGDFLGQAKKWLGKFLP